MQIAYYYVFIQLGLIYIFSYIQFMLEFFLNLLKIFAMFGGDVFGKDFVVNILHMHSQF